MYRDLKFEILNDEKQFGRVGTSKRIYSDAVIFAERKVFSKSRVQEGLSKIYDAAVSQRVLQRLVHVRGIKQKNFGRRKLA